jgi:hypothetical protein
LVARSGDPQLAAQAAALPARNGEDLFEDDILFLHAVADPTSRAGLLRELHNDPGTITDSYHRTSIVRALADVPGVIDDLEADPQLVDSIGRYFLARIFANTCDSSVRARLAKLNETHVHVLDGALARIDDCIATQRKLAPIFRAWLAP